MRRLLRPHLAPAITNQTIIIITSATWELTDGETVLQIGVCEVEDNNLIKILLEPEKRGVFMLHVVYHIPPDTKKTGVSVIVC